ncbi:hypothetical protein [Aeromonas veronii]|uniref:hypothetical protein n=1 Tax=Aeromonas veronii TaxID=654 RepID=UPI003D191E00
MYINADLVVLGREAMQVVDLAERTISDIKSARYFIMHSDAGCPHSRGLALAFIQSSSSGVEEFSEQISIIRRKMRKFTLEPECKMALQAKEGVFLIISKAFEMESGLHDWFEILRSEAEQFVV